MLDHYYGNPLSVLTDLDTQDERFDTVPAQLTDDQLLQIKMLPSIRAFIEQKVQDDPELAGQLLTNDITLREWIQNWITDILNYQRFFRLGFECMIELSLLSKIPSLKRSVKMLYLLALEEELVESDYFKMLLNTVKRMTVSELQSYLTSVSDLLSEEPEYFEDEMQEIQGFLEQFGQENESEDEQDLEEEEEAEVEFILKHGKKRAAVEAESQRKSRVSMVLKPKGFEKEVDDKLRLEIHTFLVQTLRFVSSIRQINISDWVAPY